MAGTRALTQLNVARSGNTSTQLRNQGLNGVVYLNRILGPNEFAKVDPSAELTRSTDPIITSIDV